MDTYSIKSDYLAEYMTEFVIQPHIWTLYTAEELLKPISIAEFCYGQFEAFKSFCEENYGFTLTR